MVEDLRLEESVGRGFGAEPCPVLCQECPLTGGAPEPRALGMALSLEKRAANPVVAGGGWVGGWDTEGAAAFMWL